MKAKRRHKLQHNVLDAELAKTIQFFKKHGWTIVWIVLAVVAVWTMVSLWRSSRSSKRSEIETEFADVHARLSADYGIPNEKPEVLLSRLEKLIDQTTVPRVSALSCADAGMICAIQAHVASQSLKAGRASGAAKSVLRARQKEYDKHVRRARDYFAKARDALPDQRLAVAKAHFGLGVLAETKAALLTGDERKKAFDEARDEYLAVGKIGSVEAHPVADQADRAIRRLYDAQGRLRGDYRSAVRMATTRPAAPTTQPATRPASQPATRPTTKPAAKSE